MGFDWFYLSNSNRSPYWRKEKVSFSSAQSNLYVRTIAGAFEKPVINIFQNLGTISLSWMVRHCSVTTVCNFQKYIFAFACISIGFPGVWGKRHEREVFAWLGILATKDEQNIKNNLHKYLTGKAHSRFSRVCLGHTYILDSFLVCTPWLLWCHLLSYRFYPLVKGVKLYTSSLCKVLLYTNAAKWILIK